MKRVKLIVAYDGTNYCGWQIQPNGITIEGVLNEHLSRLLKEPIVVTGASRTDAGVHSMGNVAVFDTNARMPADKISYALNAGLPKDIVVQDSCEVEQTFHPRKCQSIKTYEYSILNRKFKIPLYRFHTHFVHRPLNLERMKDAAVYLEGEHDFKSFCSIHTQARDTIRHIISCDVEKEGDIITIRVKGYGFLYNMVRIIAGTLIQAGSLEIEPSDVEKIRNAKDREKAGPTAPAQGLTMIGIEYL